jgi:beta-glucosidase
MDYAIYPEGFYRAIKAVAKLGVPVYITENGIADARDDRRDSFITRYLYCISKALKNGTDIRGYYYWTLMDNFEWSLGYDMKFGLYEVDRSTLERTLRPGAEAFRRMVTGD